MFRVYESQREKKNERERAREKGKRRVEAQVIFSRLEFLCQPVYEHHSHTSHAQYLKIQVIQCTDTMELIGCSFSLTLNACHSSFTRSINEMAWAAATMPTTNTTSNLFMLFESIQVRPEQRVKSKVQQGIGGKKNRKKEGRKN